MMTEEQAKKWDQNRISYLRNAVLGPLAALVLLFVADFFSLWVPFNDPVVGSFIFGFFSLLFSILFMINKEKSYQRYRYQEEQNANR